MTTGTADTPQFSIGEYQFSLNTAVAQTLDRNTEQRWGKHSRFGQYEALQDLGPGADTITLAGVIYPAWRGGAGQLDAMRATANLGEPLMLVDGAGNVYGWWVIEGIDEKAQQFAALGVPRKQEFTMKLRYFDGGGGVDPLLDYLWSLF